MDNYVFVANTIHKYGKIHHSSFIFYHQIVTGDYGYGYGYVWFVDDDMMIT